MEADPYEWDSSVPLGSKISKLEESLCCAICNNYYDNPHVLNCGHSFCNSCILTHLDSFFNKTSTCKKCPSCNLAADSFHLKPNRNLSTIISNYHNARKLLLDLINNTATTTIETTKNNIQTETNNTTIASSSSTSNNIPIRKLAHKVFYKYPRNKIKTELINLCNSCGSTG